VYVKVTFLNFSFSTRTFFYLINPYSEVSTSEAGGMNDQNEHYDNFNMSKLDISKSYIQHFMLIRIQACG
jgi:hypothetical protein